VVNWDNILTREGVMKLLKISHRTYQRWLHKGFLSKIKRKIGRQCLFDKEEILKELEKMPES
jgi:predicted site-specific integrase-resolvase